MTELVSDKKSQSNWFSEQVCGPLFVRYIENQFLSNLMAPNLNFTAATSTIALALFHLAEKNLIIL